MKYGYILFLIFSLSCSFSREVEKPPVFSKITISEWQNFKPVYFDSSINLLDKLLTPTAKEYIKKLEENSAVVLMSWSFGTSISSAWYIKEWDGKKRIAGFSLLNEPGFNLDFKSILLCIAYYRHLQNIPFNFQQSKDSMINKYPPLKSCFGCIINSELLPGEIRRSYDKYLLNKWDLNDSISGGYIVQAKDFLRQVDVIFFQGRIVSKNLVTGEVGIKISGLELHNKSIDSYSEKNAGKILQIGQVIERNPFSLTNYNKPDFQ